jgi:hypothetical protein
VNDKISNSVEADILTFLYGHIEDFDR